MLKKYISKMIVLSMIGGSVIGCSQGQKTHKAPQQKTIQLIDQIGREITIDGEVERIVSSYYLVSSMLIALEAEDKLVGIEMKADTREIYKAAAPNFLDLPEVGSGKTINIEEVLSLEPDLVIIPYRLESFIPQLESLGLPVLVVKPETLDEFLGCIDLVGQAIGHTEQAEALRGYHEEALTFAKGLTEDIEDRPSVYMSGSDSIFKTVTGSMYQNQLIDIAGGTNVTRTLKDDYWMTLTPEELVAYNPSYIYPVAYANYGIEEVLDNQQLAKIEAIEKAQVTSFPSVLEPWDYPTPSSALGVLWLLQELHPELYSKEAFEKEAVNFYKTFYDIDVTSEQLGL